MTHNYTAVCRLNHHSPWAPSVNLFSLLRFDVFFSTISCVFHAAIHQLCISSLWISEYFSLFFVFLAQFFLLFFFLLFGLFTVAHFLLCGFFGLFVPFFSRFYSSLSLYPRASSASFAWPTFFCTGFWLIPTSRHLRSKQFPWRDYQWAFPERTDPLKARSL